MTISDISKRYNIEIKKLQIFEKNNLITESSKFDDADLEKISVLCSLYDCGLSIDNIKEFMSICAAKPFNCQIEFLIKCRSNLLDEIHKTQKGLDKLDYIIYEMKTTKHAMY